MKNKELYSLLDGLKNSSHFQGLKFALMVAKNTKAVSEEISAIEQSQPPPPDAYVAYDLRRVKLAEAHADRTEEGDAVVVADQYQIILRKSEFEEAWTALKSEYAEAIMQRQVQMNEFQSFMEEESSVGLVQLSHEDLPGDITGGHISRLLPVLDL